MSYSQIFLIVLVSTLGKIFAKELPPFLHVCHKSDPNLEPCIMGAIEEIRPYLIKGVPEFSIPSIEPLVLQDLISEEVAGMKIVTSNVSAYGCGEFFVRDIKVDLVTHLYQIFIDIPKLRIEAHYSVDGKLLVVPIRGNGDMEANVTDCVTTYVTQAELYDKDGERYMRFISSELKVQVGGGHIRLENLFNGDKILLGVINEALNKNLDPFLKELMPVIEKALSRTFLEVSNDIVDGYTLNQLFPQ